MRCRRWNWKVSLLKSPHRMALTNFRNVNIPWPDQGMGDGDYMYAFQEVVMPIAQEFDPDLVISKRTLLLSMCAT